MVHDRKNGNGIVVGDFAWFIVFLIALHMHMCIYIYNIVLFISYVPCLKWSVDHTKTPLKIERDVNFQFPQLYLSTFAGDLPTKYEVEDLQCSLLNQRIIPVTLQLMQLFPLLFSNHSYFWFSAGITDASQSQSEVWHQHAVHTFGPARGPSKTWYIALMFSPFISMYHRCSLSSNLINVLP